MKSRRSRVTVLALLISMHTGQAFSSPPLGGKLLVFGGGAMDEEKKRFLFDVGTDYVGASRFSFDYTVAKPPIAAGRRSQAGRVA